MNKKVGLAIVTYGTNYGTYLQAFATQYIVRKQGYDTEVINIESVRNEVGSARRKYFAKQIFNIPELKSYMHVIIGIFFEKINNSYREYINNRKMQFKKFREKMFCFSEVRDSWDGLTDLCTEKSSHVLVGSDQLWRPANIAGNFYTLNFVPDSICKIAYAPSFGLKNVKSNQIDIARHFLNRINHLSVREESGAKIVSSLIGRAIPVVCDPTMLLTRSEWSDFVAVEPIIKDKYILCYFLGDNKIHREYVKKLSARTGCKIVVLRHIAGYIALDKNFGDIVPNDIGPFEFLNLVKNADYVCTDSFHGCVFASIFERNLFAFRRFVKNSKMSTNDRITTLLNKLGSDNALIYGDESLDDCLKNIIDYNDVAEKLDQYREYSLNYLKTAFANMNTDLKS